MPFGCSPLVRAGGALLAVAGALLLAPPRLAHACVPEPGPRPVPPPAGTVAFSGTLVDARAVPGTSLQGIGQVYTFAVDDVFLGVAGPQAVVVDLDAAVPFTDILTLLPCVPGDPVRLPAYQSFIAAWPNPADGELHMLHGGYVGGAMEQAYAVQTARQTTPPPATPVPRPSPSAPAAGYGSGGGRIVLAFLAEVAILGLAALAGAVYLRARELDLEERELALREREAGRRS